MDSGVQNKDNEKKGSKPLIFGLIGLGAAIVAVIILLIVNPFSSSYVAKIGNEKVSTWEFQFYLTQVKSSMLQSAQQTDPSITSATFWNTKYQGENALDYAKKQTLDAIKESKVQLIKAKTANIKLTSDQQQYINDYEKKIAQQNNITTQEVVNQLKSQFGISLSQYKSLLKEQALESNYAQAEIKKITDTDVQNFYNKNQDLYKNSSYRSNGEEAVWVRHILIDTVDPNTMQPLSQDKQDEALKKAQDLLTKVNNGEDFATLAEKNSQDTGSAEYGGDYVFAKGHNMDPAFESAAFNLSPGQTTKELVKSQFGYHIIQLVEKYPAGTPVSLKCATDYREYGKQFVYQNQQLKQLVASYKTDINQAKYNSIK
ncbi:MAG: peptidylprolyl isomerase [Bacillota bacterium]|nr:peptidylprolyl isomerase [Bacillota bacterium]